MQTIEFDGVKYVPAIAVVISAESVAYEDDGGPVKVNSVLPCVSVDVARESVEKIKAAIKSDYPQFEEYMSVKVAERPELFTSDTLIVPTPTDAPDMLCGVAGEFSAFMNVAVNHNKVAIYEANWGCVTSDHWYSPFPNVDAKDGGDEAFDVYDLLTAIRKNNVDFSAYSETMDDLDVNDAMKLAIELGWITREGWEFPEAV